MGTTTAGLPYPEPTDPVADGAAAIKALAEAVARPFAQYSVAAWTSAATVPLVLPAVTRTIPVKGGQLYAVSFIMSGRWNTAFAGGTPTVTLKAAGVSICAFGTLKAMENAERWIVTGAALWTPAADATPSITLELNQNGGTGQNTFGYGWRIEPVQ